MSISEPLTATTMGGSVEYKTPIVFPMLQQSVVESELTEFSIGLNTTSSGLTFNVHLFIGTNCTHATPVTPFNETVLNYTHRT